MLTALVFAGSAFGQSNQTQKDVVVNKPVTEKPGEDKVFDIVEEMPSFVGGSSALMAWLAVNAKYPVEAQKNGISGRVIVSFIIERDGSVSHVEVTRAVDPILDKEAVRVVELMPKWNPGKQDGQPVRVKYSVPILFRMS